MKKFLASAMLACISFMPMGVSAQDLPQTLVYDAGSWFRLDDSQRLFMVEGIIAGFGSGFSDAWFKTTNKPIDYANVTFSHEPEFYKAEIDDFYTNHPNTWRPPSELMACFVDKPLQLCNDGK